jgi:hypothetical protein
MEELLLHNTGVSQVSWQTDSANSKLVPFTTWFLSVVSSKDTKNINKTLSFVDLIATDWK